MGRRRATGIAQRAAGLVEGGAQGLDDAARRRGDARGDPYARYELEHARALLALGEALRRAGDAAEAREPLRASGRLADAAGAEGLVERAERGAARPAGAKRVKRAVLAGADSLTPTRAPDRRMAAEGSRNREIAQTLFVTKKTVETHLSHVYAKLGIAGRARPGRCPEGLDLSVVQDVLSGE